MVLIKYDLQNIEMHPEWRLVLAAVFLGLFCFLPFLFGVSIIYPSILFLCACAAFVRRKFAVATVILLCAVGYSHAAFKLEPRNIPAFKDGQYHQIIGEIVAVEQRDDGKIRLTVRNFEPLFTARVLVQRTYDEAIYVGEHITLGAILSKPQGPIFPSGFNFAQSAFLKGIDAQGFVVTSITKDYASQGAYSIALLRQNLAEYLYEEIGEQEGAIAAALLVGVKSYLSNDTKESLRSAGLAHLLAISGLHVGLIAAIGFFVFEYIFALFPKVSHRYMPRKLAVFPTMMMVIFYLIISGMGVATFRAVIMVTIALIAVLMDRRVISLRSVAIAAIAILIIWPENIVSISFQLSFAATTALVTFYEWFSRSEWSKHYHQREGAGVSLRLSRALSGIVMTSLIAQIGILPFALYHFQEISIVALLANALVLPIVTFIIMPLLVCIFLLWLIGAGGVIAPILGFFVSIILDITAWCASFPWATVQTFQLYQTSFALLLIIGMFCVLIRHRFIVFAGAGLAVGVFIFGFKTPADLLIDRGGKFFAQYHNEKMYISSRYRDSFRNKAWLKYWALSKHDVSKLSKQCDRNACLYELKNDYKLVIIKTFDAIRPACSMGDIIILPRKYQRYCRTDALVLTDKELRTNGPLGIYIGQNEKAPFTLEWSLPKSNNAL